MFTPGERGANPFLSFAYALNAKLNLSNHSETELSWALQTISSEDKGDHSNAENLLRQLLKPSDPNSEVLIVIDQFEEIFTQSSTELRDKFLIALEHIITLPRFRAIATIRVDFYERAIREPVLANLLRLDRSTFPLDPPAMGAILQMIIRPAEATGVELEDGLAQCLLDDAGTGPGAMPLIAFTLNQLYGRTEGADFISIDAYTAFSGVKGAVQQRAITALEGLPKHINLNISLPILFSALVEVNEQEIATRRRLPVASLPEEANLLAERLIDARLLVSSKGEDNQATVEVAHEIVLSGWEQLQQWILKHSAALRARRDLEKAASEWDKTSRSGSALRTGTMLKRYEGAAEPHSVTATEYLTACQQRRRNYRAALFVLLLLSAFTLEYIRFVYIKHPDYPLPLGTKAFFIQYRLKPLPEPDMVEIPAGKFLMGSPATEKGRLYFEDQKEVTIDHKFSIGTASFAFDKKDKHVIFIKSEGGCADGHEISLPDDNKSGRDKMPVINVSWHDAQCYAEWLAKKTGKNYRLPTESEWEYAARAGTQTPYYWGNEVTHDNANYGTEECCNGLIRGKDQWFYTSPVGSFAPNKWGLYDTAGNVWEWTCSDYVEKFDGNEQACHSQKSTLSIRSLRGGSLDNGSSGMRSANRYAYVATNSRYVLGFRLVISPYPKDVPPPPPCKGGTVIAPPTNTTDSKLDIPMIKINGGCFPMGSPDTEPEREKDENFHQICLKDYELGKYEVTQDLWKRVMGTNPSNCQGEKLPVESVSWNEIQQFILKLNQSTGKRYRLPTEAEWEYAARAGTTTPFYTGNCIDTNLANFNGKNYTGCSNSISQNEIVAIGSYNPNGIGLYDMAGNVFEWTCSVYMKDYNGSETGCDKGAIETNNMLAIRGGSYKSDANKLRSASRHKLNDNYSDTDFGFRLARDLAELTKTNEQKRDRGR
jgi:formylglycine-generating enzyme required for sulfatase activity